MSIFDSLTRLFNQCTGALLCFGAYIAFTLMDAAAQSSIRHGLTSSQVAFLRMALTLPFVTLYIIVRNPSAFQQLDPRSRPVPPVGPSDNSKLDSLLLRRPAFAARLIWLRSFLTTLALCLLYAGLSRVSLSEFITIGTTKAFIIGFLCWLVLREPFGWRLRLASVILSVAVILIVQPAFLFGHSPSLDPTSRILGFEYCFASLLMDALEMVVMRTIGLGPDPVVIMLAYAITCVVVGPVLLLVVGDSAINITDNIVFAKLMLVAVLGLVAQICLVMSIQRESGGTIAVIAYSQIPMSVIVESFILGGTPNLLEGAGIVLILVSGIWAVVAESIEREDLKTKVDQAEEEALLSTEIDLSAEESVAGVVG